MGTAAEKKAVSGVKMLVGKKSSPKKIVQMYARKNAGTKGMPSLIRTFLMRAV